MQVRDADCARDALGPQRLHRQPVGQELVVDGGQGVEEQIMAGGVDAQGVAVQGD